MNINTRPHTTSDERLEAGRDAPFPLESLPIPLQDFVNLQSTRYHADPGAVAFAALSILSNVLVRYSGLPAANGQNTSIGISACLSTTASPAVTRVVDRMIDPLNEIQRERLEEAAAITKADLDAIREAPLFDEHPYNRKSPETLIKERALYLRALKSPVFVVRNPTPADLKRSLAESCDHTVLVVSERLLDELRDTSTAGRARQSDLYSCLTQGGILQLPTRRSKSLQPMVHPAIGLLLTSTRDSVEMALNCRVGNVRSILDTCVIYHARAVEEPGTPVSSQEAELWWAKMIGRLLEYRNLPPNDPSLNCLYAQRHFAAWEKSLLANGCYASLVQNHFSPFTDLPRRITACLSAVTGSSPQANPGMLNSSFKISRWMVTQTLLATMDARRAWVELSSESPEEVMFRKIQRAQPIKFWQLRRSYNRQSLERHQPVLTLLLKQGRVRYNGKRELEVVR